MAKDAASWIPIERIPFSLILWFTVADIAHKPCSQNSSIILCIINQKYNACNVKHCDVVCIQQGKYLPFPQDVQDRHYQPLG
ncbi:MAG: hypothetical protein ABWY78_18875 [Microvirga sp.]